MAGYNADLDRHIAKARRIVHREIAKDHGLRADTEDPDDKVLAVCDEVHARATADANSRPQFAMADPVTYEVASVTVKTEDGRPTEVHFDGQQVYPPKMPTCETCKWWIDEPPFDPHGPDERQWGTVREGFRICKADPPEPKSDFRWLHTAPDFGCTQHEAKG